MGEYRKGSFFALLTRLFFNGSNAYQNRAKTQYGKQSVEMQVTHGFLHDILTA